MLTPVVPSEVRDRRIRELLTALDAYTEKRHAALMALTDCERPNPHATLAEAGLKMAAGATLRQIFTYAAEFLGRPEWRIDREDRDYTLLPLRAVGILEQLFVRPRAELTEYSALFERGWWRPKSPTSSYVLTEDALRLLLFTPEDEWDDELEEFVTATPPRRERFKQRRAVEMLAGAGEETKHTALIEAACEALLTSQRLARFEQVFKDDGDDDRVKEPWASKLDELGLVLDLGSRYPDAILADGPGRCLWFVDAVTSDGEIDIVRLRELSDWARRHGWKVAGATSAYADYRTYSRRQAANKNVASGTTVWIAEDGGKLIEIGSLA